MNLTSYPTALEKPIRNWRKIALISAGLLTLVLAITAVSLLLSPMGRRWQADQTAAPATIGATEIDVIGDEALNHIFAPAVTQVQTGAEVTWHFKEVDEDGEPVAHNVVFEDIASPVLTTGTFSRTFDEPGTYAYTCTLHAYMDGVVIVTE